MATVVTNSSLASAWLAATTQQAQTDALVSAWGGANVVLRYYTVGGTLLDTVTHGPWQVVEGSPRTVVPGAPLARLFGQEGTAAYCTASVGATPYLRADVALGASVAERRRTNLGAGSGAAGLVVSADVGLPGLPSEWTSVAIVSEDAGVPHTTADQTPVLQLHESGAGNMTTGRQYRAQVTGLQAYDTYTEFAFSTVRGVAALGKNVAIIRPIDSYGTYPSAVRRESMWMGFTSAPDAPLRLITERRVRALLSWSKTLPNLAWNRLCLIGGSMGAWGCATLGPVIEDEVAAIYASRPRVRYNNFAAATVSVPNWPSGATSYPVASAPALSADDGGGSVATKMDFVAYVSNAANPLPWIGFCLGRNDGFAPFEDFVALVSALRATGRGFACVWNDGNHTGGNVISQITASYPYGTFDTTKGYPLFTNHSGDADPAVDVSGGINEGLSFRNVVESAGSWSCEVTSILGARTVDVKPRSTVFTASVSAQNISIPAANTWVPVTFTA